MTPRCWAESEFSNAERMIIHAVHVRSQDKTADSTSVPQEMES